MIYRPALLTPERDADVIPLPQQRHHGRRHQEAPGQRDSLVQRFHRGGQRRPRPWWSNYTSSPRVGLL